MPATDGVGHWRHGAVRKSARDERRNASDTARRDDARLARRCVDELRRHDRSSARERADEFETWFFDGVERLGRQGDGARRISMARRTRVDRSRRMKSTSRFVRRVARFFGVEQATRNCPDTGDEPRENDALMHVVVVCGDGIEPRCVGVKTWPRRDRPSR